MDNIDIIHQDDQLLVVNKPAGVIVHPGNGSTKGATISEMVSHLVEDDEPTRPGIVHRLDKDTSGVLVIARNQEAKRYLAAQFKERTVDKTYTAAVRGHLKQPRARLELPISRSPKNPMRRMVRHGGKMAISEYTVIEEKLNASLVEVKILTGRTHQIRVHFQYLGHPVLGDGLYGDADKALGRLFLHASTISFTHPDGNRLTFEAPLPHDLEQFWYNQPS